MTCVAVIICEDLISEYGSGGVEDGA